MKVKDKHIVRKIEGFPPHNLESRRYREALKKAIDCLLKHRLLERHTEDGLRVGVQANISTQEDGSNAHNLSHIQRVAKASSGEAANKTGQTALWQKILADIQRRLGFSIEPEFFSNMLFASYLGHLPNHAIRDLAEGLCETYRDRALFGLYGFFATMRFAADIDCTGVAMRSRIVLGEVDPETESGAEILRATTSQILKSASVAQVSARENCNHGKENGALELNVFKVYLDNHEIQGALLDRGLKQDAAVVNHGLYAVLFEVAHGLRDLDEEIRLLEYVAGCDLPRQRCDTVGNIIKANINFLRAQFETGVWLSGTRYYSMPDALLCFTSELCTSFSDFFEAIEMTPLLQNSLAQLRAKSNDPNALELSLRVISAQNLGLDSETELEGLLQLQDEAGGFSQFCPLYKMPTPKNPVYFGSAEQTLSFAIRALSNYPPVSISPTKACGKAAFTQLAQQLVLTR